MLGRALWRRHDGQDGDCGWRNTARFQPSAGGGVGALHMHDGACSVPHCAHVVSASAACVQPHAAALALARTLTSSHPIFLICPALSPVTPDPLRRCQTATMGALHIVTPIIIKRVTLTVLRAGNMAGPAMLPALNTARAVLLTTHPSLTVLVGALAGGPRAGRQPAGAGAGAAAPRAPTRCCAAPALAAAAAAARSAACCHACSRCCCRWQRRAAAS